MLTNENINDVIDKYIDKDEDTINTYGNISSWNTSKVTNMDNLFKNKLEFNEDISSWDVSNVTSMTSMFHNAKKFNKPINSWNTSNVTNI